MAKKSNISEAPIRGFRVSNLNDFRYNGMFRQGVPFYMRPNLYSPTVQGEFTTNNKMDLLYFKHLIETGHVWVKL